MVGEDSPGGVVIGCRCAGMEGKIVPMTSEAWDWVHGSGGIVTQQWMIRIDPMGMGRTGGMFTWTIKIPPVYDRNRWISSRWDTMIYGGPTMDGQGWDKMENGG